MELEENLDGNKLYLVIVVNTNKEYQYTKTLREQDTTAKI
jgi:hypothetical protein